MRRYPSWSHQPVATSTFGSRTPACSHHKHNLPRHAHESFRLVPPDANESKEQREEGQKVKGLSMPMRARGNEGGRSSCLWRAANAAIVSLYFHHQTLLSYPYISIFYQSPVHSRGLYQKPLQFRLESPPMNPLATPAQRCDLAALACSCVFVGCEEFQAPAPAGVARVPSATIPGAPSRHCSGFWHTPLESRRESTRDWKKPAKMET